MAGGREAVTDVVETIVTVMVVGKIVGQDFEVVGRETDDDVLEDVEVLVV